MSKLYAKSYMWTKGIDKDDVREFELSFPVKVRYLKKTKEYHFQCLDVIQWLISGQRAKETCDFRIKEEIISRFFSVDKLILEKRIEEIDYKAVKAMEIGDLDDFYDDQYLNLCFIQYHYYLSKEILKDIKRRAHIWALGRVESPWFALTAIPINKHGGRPIGGGGFGDPYISLEEQARLLENLEMYDKIISKYIKSDVSLLKFIDMHKQLSKLGNRLPEWMQKPFMKREEGLTWYWHALRYNYKKENGLELKPTEDEIRQMQLKYGFPWTPC